MNMEDWNEENVKEYDYFLTLKQVEEYVEKEIERQEELRDIYLEEVLKLQKETRKQGDYSFFVVVDELMGMCVDETDLSFAKGNLLAIKSCLKGLKKIKELMEGKDEK